MFLHFFCSVKAGDVMSDPTSPSVPPRRNYTKKHLQALGHQERHGNRWEEPLQKGGTGAEAWRWSCKGHAFIRRVLGTGHQVAGQRPHLLTGVSEPSPIITHILNGRLLKSPFHGSEVALVPGVDSSGFSYTKGVEMPRGSTLRP